MSTGHDVFDILVTVRAEGSPEVHLAPSNWVDLVDVATLCGRPIRELATEESFARHGCCYITRSDEGRGAASRTLRSTSDCLALC